jgi:signal transduction histidine kinase
MPAGRTGVTATLSDPLAQGGRHALELVARRVALGDVLDLLARLIEQQADGMLCSILLTDAAGTRLTLGAAPSLPAEFKDLLLFIPIGPTMGSCGTAAFRRETVVVSDLASDDLCVDFRDVALAHGLRSCWSTPFFSTGGRVLGTVAMYDRAPRGPSAADLLLVEQAANVTGLVVEREEIEQERGRLAEEAAAKHATLSAVLGSMSDGLVTLDPDNRIHYCNGRAGEFFGITPSGLIGEDVHALFSAIERALTRPMDVWSAARKAMAEIDARPSFEVVIARPHPRDIAVQFFPVLDEQRQLTGTGILLRDVTQPRRLAMLQDRERIAMDLHDGIVQSLYGLALGLGARDRSIPPHWTETREALKNTIAQINMVIRDIRQYIRTLQPERVMEQDLRAGLAVLTDELRINGLLCPQVELDPEAEELLDPEVTGHLLYVAHEATSNIIRHAAASAATIRLVRSNGHASLAITDDGRGFVPQRTGRRTGDGLRNMAERAAMIGAVLTVDSAPGRGTEVRVELLLAGGARSK